MCVCVCINSKQIFVSRFMTVLVPVLLAIICITPHGDRTLLAAGVIRPYGRVRCMMHGHIDPETSQGSLA